MSDSEDRRSDFSGSASDTESEGEIRGKIRSTIRRVSPSEKGKNGNGDRSRTPSEYHDRSSR